jgi:hypothetical protein
MPTCNQPRPLTLMTALILGLGLGVSALSGCSEDGLRDMNYGTDVGGGYQLPDGLLDRMPVDPAVDAARDAGTSDAADAAPGTQDAAPLMDTTGDTGPALLLDALTDMAPETAADAGQALDAG